MTPPPIEYLSAPGPVSMGDEWYDLVNLDHFWIRRRFEVLRKLAAGYDWRPLKIAEIGCGNGLLQRQFEDQFGTVVDGYDLNESSLRATHCRQSRRICYDIHTRNEALRAVYDAVVLFDVLEHIEDPLAFLKSACFHLKPGGVVLINVPARPDLFSQYDTVVGHLRRYLAEDLLALMEAACLETTSWSYWGKAMIPLLQIRKRRFKQPHPDTLRDGIASRGTLVNAALLQLSRLELLPNHQTGTSLMVFARLGGKTAG